MTATEDITADQIQPGYVVLLDETPMRVEVVSLTTMPAIAIEVQSNDPKGPTGRWTYVLMPEQFVERVL